MTTHDRQLVWISLPPAADAPKILPSPFPERESGDITELAASVARHGVLSPLLLRPTEGGGWQIVCGQRRWLAAQAAGLDRIPGQVARLSDGEAIRCYLAENLVRRPLAAGPPTPTNALPAAAGARPVTIRPALPPATEGLGPRLSRALGQVATAAGGGSSVRAETLPERLDAPQARAVVRLRSFYQEVRATRSINVPRAEILLDTLLELWQSEALPAGHWADLPRVSQLDPIADHALLTTHLALQTTGNLGWSETDLRDFLLGTLLHDVGMVFVLPGAWGEARPLRDSERGEVESHTRIGHALIAGTREWDEEVARLARDHHERWNGSGYPGHLRGTEVSLPCRILSLIDAFAAMTSPRPHRDAMSPAHAASRLLGAMEMGLFDPALGGIVNALAACRTEADVEGAASLDAPAPRISVELSHTLNRMPVSEST